MFEEEKKEIYYLNKENKMNFYEESINNLVQYIKNNEKNPSEKCWNHYAIDKKCLSSKTIGYLSGINFNSLCKEIRKELNKKKR